MFFKNFSWNQFKQFCISYCAWLVYYLFSVSWRIQLVKPPSLIEKQSKKLPIVFAHWHGDELAILHLVKHFQLATMTSTSKDGQLIDFIIHKLGGATSKGSSTRKAIQGLKGLLQLGKRGHPISMAVDGPKGPLHKVKHGVFEISKILHAPIYPVGVHCTSALRFKKSWNQTFLPLPFSRLVIFFPEPLDPISSDQDPRSPENSLKLENKLFNARQQALRFIVNKKT